MTTTNISLGQNFTVTGNLNASSWGTTSYTTSYTTNPLYINNSMNPPTGDVLISNGRLRVGGDDPDILLGNVSLMKFIEDINQRLNMLQPNTKLEKDWEELRELGDQYRRLEKDLIEKAKVWNILKTT